MSQGKDMYPQRNHRLMEQRQPFPSTTIPVAPTFADRAISFGRSFMTPSPATAASTAPTTTGNPLEALIGKTQDRKLVEMKKLGI